MPEVRRHTILTRGRIHHPEARAHAMRLVILAIAALAALATLAAQRPTTGPIGEQEPSVVTETQFAGATIPPGWRFSGAPWIINNGAYSPAHGDYGTIISYAGGGSGVSTLDQETLRARVKLMSRDSIFALCTQGQYGTIAEVDGVHNVLRYYLSWSGGDPVGTLGTVHIPFTLKAGREYWLTLTKTLGSNRGAIEHQYTFTLTDAQTKASVNYTAFFVGGANHWPGHMWGAPGMMFRSGRIEVCEFKWSTPFPPSPRLWIGGDSFVEGDSIYASKGKRFAQQLYMALHGNVVISGGGGATSADLLARLPLDLGPFRPKFCLVLIGANDNDFDQWRENVVKIVAYVQSKGATPILGTLAPRKPRQAFLNRANSWIISSGYTYVDFAAALTQNRDRLTWNPALALGDGVHPNVAGHTAMVAQIRVDAPFLFEDNRDNGSAARH